MHDWKTTYWNTKFGSFSLSMEIRDVYKWSIVLDVRAGNSTYTHYVWIAIGRHPTDMDIMQYFFLSQRVCNDVLINTLPSSPLECSSRFCCFNFGIEPDSKLQLRDNSLMRVIERWWFVHFKGVRPKGQSHAIHSKERSAVSLTNVPLPKRVGSCSHALTLK